MSFNVAQLKNYHGNLLARRVIDRIANTDIRDMPRSVPFAKIARARAREPRIVSAKRLNLECSAVKGLTQFQQSFHFNLSLSLSLSFSLAVWKLLSVVSPTRTRVS